MDKDTLTIKCRNCRVDVLISERSHFKNSHGHQINLPNMIDCSGNELIFVDLEEISSNRLNEQVQESEWSKGKFKCTNCNLVIGSFNYLETLKCRCNRNVLPPVRISKSKVDVVLQPIVLA